MTRSASFRIHLVLCLACMSVNIEVHAQAGRSAVSQSALPRIVAHADSRLYVPGNACRRLVPTSGYVRWCAFEQLPSGAYVRVAMCTSRRQHTERDDCYLDSSTVYVYVRRTTGALVRGPAATDSTSDGEMLFWGDQSGTHAFDVASQRSELIGACWNARYLAAAGAVYCINAGLQLVHIALVPRRERPTVVATATQPGNIRFLLGNTVRDAPALNVALDGRHVTFSQQLLVYGDGSNCFGEWESGSYRDANCVSYLEFPFVARIELDRR